MDRFDKMLQDARSNASAAGINHLDAPTIVEAAQFDIIITRVSANIAENLPIPIFGLVALKAGLGQDISQYLPANTTLVAIQFGTTFSSGSGATLTQDLANAQKLTLQYKNGQNLDTITVTCSSTPYPQFAESTMSDVFKLSKIRYSISNVALTAQYSQQLIFKKKTIFGKVIENSLTPTAFRTPQDFQTGVVDIDVNADVDKETAIWTNILSSVGFSVTLSIFVSRSARLNANVL